MKQSMTDRQQTHYAGCWRDPKHHDCAVREMEALTADKRRLDWLAERGSITMTRLISLEGGRWSDPFFEIETSDDYYKAPTMRDAIDKAMEADHD